MSKKTKSLLLAVFALAALFFRTGLIEASPGSTHEKSRIINVVMDDSWSMVIGGEISMPGTNGTPLTRWAQARYSLMVLAGMLGENDTLNIYYLNDWSHSRSRQPITILGASPAQERIDSVRSYIPFSGGTPVDALKAAASDLKSANADGLYLVIISDGKFDNGGRAQELVDEIRGSAPQNQEVIFLGIGDDAPKVEGGFSASDHGNEILDQIVHIGNLIFGRLKLPEGFIENQSFDTGDVGMGRLIVFAQGEGVRINGLTNNGTLISPIQKTVLPTPEPKEAARHLANDPSLADILTDAQLSGAIAEFTNIEPGQVSLDIENATQVSFYYEPDFEVGLQLTHLKTGEVFNSQIQDHPLIAGDYLVEFGPVDASGNFIRSPLLGNDATEPELLESTFRAGDWTQSMVESGSEIHIPAGLLQVEVRQLFLDRYEKVVSLPTDSVGFTILEGSLLISPIDSPTFNVRDLADAQTFRLRISNEDGRDLSQSDWDNLETPIITSPQNIGLTAQKTSELGIVEVTATAPHGNIFRADTGEIAYSVNAVIGKGQENARFGEFDDNFTITDTIGAGERLTHWLKGNWWIPTIALLGGTWGIAKLRQPKLPRKFARNDGFIESPNGQKSPVKSKIKIKNKWKNILWPFAPQEISFTPFEGGGMTLLATSPSRMKKLKIKEHQKFTRKKGEWKIGGGAPEPDKDGSLFIWVGDKIIRTEDGEIRSNTL
ncbi:MAG: hypothetical protein FWF59_13235 [Turicibacter sp.]|nr:hypothetical protein [Turicibacter sp.]